MIYYTTKAHTHS